MGNWTPGPWEYIDASKSARYRFAPNCVIRGNGKQIASFSWGDPLYWPVKDESQANARLIAAAPQLLEALEQIGHSIKQARIAGNDWKRELALIENTVRAAIAKATGAHA